ncbi:MAG: hypothetical protein PHY26_00015 [Bacilli bacterium]|jgi:hypothetical protein|nr:hypothetical protein [Bacilli bacterium]
MTKEQKVNFDMSTLSLSELIKVYEEIINFLNFLEEKKIVEEKVAQNE